MTIFPANIRPFVGIVLSIGTMALSQAASAAAVDHTFDFTYVGSPVTSITTQVSAQPLVITSNNGLAANVTGTGTGVCTPPCANDGRLYRGQYGIGVFDQWISHNEMVSIDISPADGVLLQSVVVESGPGAQDTLQIYVDGTLILNYLAPTTGASNTIDLSSYSASGSLFQFKGFNDPSRLGSPTWALTSLTVRVGSAPEPAALASLGIGLAVLALARGRKTQ